MKLEDFYYRKEKNDTLVKIIALIRKNKTGEIREYKDELYWGNWYQDEEPSTYIWEDGNYSCDCNRYLFFQRVKNENEDNEECGDELYSVNLKNPKNEEIFYKEY
jgi:predicted dehydrogenase